MPIGYDIGKFDLDMQLREASVDEKNRPTRRMIANACIGVEAFDAYYSVRELTEILKDIFEGRARAKSKLTRILSTQCDDFQRCIYYCLAGRGIIQMLDDLDWLLAMLAARAVVSGECFRRAEPPIAPVNPYVAAQPDGPVVAADAVFEEGPSWYLDPGLGGELAE